MNFLGFFNQGWVGSLIGLIGVIYAIYSYRKSKIGAKLVYQLESMNIIEQKTKSLKEVEIFYKGLKVPRIIKTKIIIWNSGYKELEGNKVVKSDPLRLKISDDEAIINAEIIRETKEANEFRIKIDDSQENILYMDFEYLNPNDGVIIEILHTDSEKKLKIEGSIKGIPKGVVNLGDIGNSIEVSKNIIFTNFNLIKSSQFLWSALVIGIIFIGIAIFAPNIVIDNTEGELDYVRLIISSVGIFYIILPSFILLINRKKYPKKLDVTAKKNKIKKSKQENYEE